jgi:hypothetical protein
MIIRDGEDLKARSVQCVTRPNDAMITLGDKHYAAPYEAWKSITSFARANRNTLGTQSAVVRDQRQKNHFRNMRDDIEKCLNIRSIRRKVFESGGNSRKLADKLREPQSDT